MDDQSKPARQSAESSDSAPAIQITEPLGALPQQPPADHNLSKTEQELEKVGRDMSGFERSTLRWTRATFIILAVTCVFIGYQGYEIRTGSTDTHTLAEQAKRQADKMKNVSDAAAGIQQAAHDMVIQEQKIADNAHTALDASNAQSRSALEATIRNFQREQRAWVGVGQYIIQNFDGKNPFRLDIPLVNSGKSPAISTESCVMYSISDQPLLGPPPETKYTFEKANPIAPQGAYVVDVENFAVPARHDDIVNGKAYLTFFGQFRYHDVYDPKTVHTTSFCLEYSKLANAMTFCYTGNDMD